MKLSWIAIIAAFLAGPATAQTTIPDIRGTWKGESESVILGGGNSHHGAAVPNDGPQLRTLPFTLTVNKGDTEKFRAAAFRSWKFNDLTFHTVAFSDFFSVS